MAKRGRKPRNPVEIFYSHVNRSNDNACWLWTASKRGDYGSGWLNGKREDAHRVSYKLFVGDIPDGLEVMHECDTPLCVNPRHLSLGTHVQNMAKTIGKRSEPRGARAKLTAESVRFARALSRQGWGYKRIGKLLGVTGTTIYSIIQGVTWKDVPDCAETSTPTNSC